MAPSVREKKTGQTQEDAARERMKYYEFMDCVIDEGIKQLLDMYGEDPWFLIESESYGPLLEICLQLTEQLAEEEQANQLTEKQKKIALEQQQYEYQLEQEQEQDLENVKEERDQADQPTNDPSPAAFHSGEAFSGFATHSVADETMHCGWLSSEEEDSDGDDEEMIPLTPEPLCEEIVKEVCGLKKRKKETSSD